MTIVQLTYTAPIYVVVDTEEGTVDRVIVGDESTKFVGDATADDGESDVSAADAAEAERIAENEEWPGWEFGW